LNEPENSILGTLVRHHEFALEELQRNSWTLQISILKERFSTKKPRRVKEQILQNKKRRSQKKHSRKKVSEDETE
tara:strand:- start:69 stop:293 length:225 start_codon:yes stop_codon:yes gene_type:complete